MEGIQRKKETKKYAPHHQVIIESCLFGFEMKNGARKEE